MARFPRAGTVRWIGLRSAQGSGMAVVDRATLVENRGLVGDHRAKSTGGRRQITLIQWEHLDVIAALCGLETVDPALLRRNLVVAGLNVGALKDRVFHLGSAIAEGTGHCHPCSRMERNLGPGGYNALRGHGGITARVIRGGDVRVGDPVRAAAAA